MSASVDVPIACQLKALSPAEGVRQKELLEIVRGKIRRTSELLLGYELEPSPDPVTRAEVEEWAGLERRCCAFAEIVVEHRPGGDLTVRITGGPGAKEVLAAEMGIVARG